MLQIGMILLAIILVVFIIATLFITMPQTFDLPDIRPAIVKFCGGGGGSVVKIRSRNRKFKPRLPPRKAKKSIQWPKENKTSYELSLLASCKDAAIAKFNNTMGKIENVFINKDQITIVIKDEHHFNNSELRNASGYCCGQSIVIREDRISEEVIIHEVAHAIDNMIRGFSCHDQYWQKINDFMGGSPNYLDRHYQNIEEYDEDHTDWMYMSDGKRMCFININTGKMVYHEDDKFHVLKRKMLSNH